MEHRKLAVDLVDVIIKWELQRIKEDAEAPSDTCEVSWPHPLRDLSFVGVILFCFIYSSYNFIWHLMELR